MADISTAVSMARVPILGENGRISDDYIPAAIGENTAKAEAAATRAKTAATAAEGSATAASKSAAGAQGSASAAEESADQARESATAASEAVTQAQSAQQAAEAAKTGAESARGSAQTAASQAKQSATAAADSAANVADKFISSAQATTLEPGSQATASVADQVLTLGIPRGDKGDKGDQGDKGDPGDVSAVTAAEGSDLSVSTDEGTVTIDDSALRERIAELENQAANVLKGTLGPAPLLSADDAYATKPRKLTVHGATRQNLWVNPSGTSNGVTVTANADGSVTVSGTATASTAFGIKSYVLKPGSTYTVSINAAMNNGACVSVQECNSDDSLIAYHDCGLSSSNLSTTFTVDGSCTSVNFRVYVPSGVTVSGTYRVMLNEGSTAEPWCPPGLNSVDELSIVTAGKNLLARMGAELPYTTAGITFSDNGDGGIRISGTATGTAYYDFFNNSTQKAPFIPSGTYTASLTGRVAGVNLVVEYFDYEVGGSYSNWLSVAINKVTESVDRPVYLRPLLYVVRGRTVDTVVYPQLELGSTATAYEPPIITETPIDLDGNTLCSLPDGTHDELTIDATGAVTLTKRVGSYVADGDEGWKLSAIDSAPYRMRVDSWKDDALNDTFTPGRFLSTVLPPSGVAGYSHGSYVVINGIYQLYAGRSGITTANDFSSWLEASPMTVLYLLAEPQTIPLPSVTLPTLPAPTVNVWADAEASGAGYSIDPDVELEYERDVTIAFNKLQAQVSATTVREATNG